MVKTKKKVKKKLRPPRIFRTKTGRKYFIRVVKGKNKRTYIKSKLPDSQIIKIIINNILSKPSRTSKKAKKKKGKPCKKRPKRKSGVSGVSFDNSENGVIIPKQELRQPLLNQSRPPQQQIDYGKLLTLMNQMKPQNQPTQGVIIPKPPPKILRFKMPQGFKLQILDKKNKKKNITLNKIDSFSKEKEFFVVDEKNKVVQVLKRDDVEKYVKDAQKAQQIIKEQKREILEKNKIILNRDEQDFINTLSKSKLQRIGLGGKILNAFKMPSKTLFKKILEQNIITQKEWTQIKAGKDSEPNVVFNGIYKKYNDILKAERKRKDEEKTEKKKIKTEKQKDKILKDEVKIVNKKIKEEKKAGKIKSKEDAKEEKDTERLTRGLLMTEIAQLNGYRGKKTQGAFLFLKRKAIFTESEIDEIKQMKTDKMITIFKPMIDQKKSENSIKAERLKEMNEAVPELQDQPLSISDDELSINESSDSLYDESEEEEEEEEKKETEITDKDEIEALGAGKGKGLSSNQLYSMMKNYKHFTGIYAIDTFRESPVKEKMGFILNLDPIKKPGSHWVACWIDTTKDKSLEYYDSLANDPPKSFLRDIKKIITKINPSTYLKFKINKIKRQSDTTDTCGYHAVKFLHDRFNNKPWIECSGYNDVKNGEKDIKKFKKKFEYI